MAGLVPAIHVFLLRQDVDARHKAGHDELYCKNARLRRESSVCYTAG
jgi:hypothetical protein